MLRRFAYNKIFRTSGMLILFLLLLLFPVSKKYSLDDEKVADTSYSVKENEVYLLDKNDYVSRYKIKAKYQNDNLKYAKYLLEMLIIDGKYQNDIPNGFKAVLPSNTIINDVKIKDDSIIIDFSSEFLELSEKYEEKAIELITYNLTTIDKISNVYVNINGKELNYLPKSKKHISQPLTRNIGVNKINNISSYKNVNMVTIYYVSKNKDDYYYVPVTKLINNQENKIKIIIEELTSTPIYENNLMSLLNYNTKLINYNIENNILSLNFNNYLFDDINSKSVLEEVIYSICLSIRDNYDTKEVIFNVEGNEITKTMLKNIE